MEKNMLPLNDQRINALLICHLKKFS